MASDEVGTSFADKLKSTISTDRRCRKFADNIVDHYIDSDVILHQTYELQVFSALTLLVGSYDP